MLPIPNAVDNDLESKSRSTVLVTGATGFIGKNVVSVLHDKGFYVHGVTSKEATTDAEVDCWHTVDLRDITKIAPLLSQVKPDYLVHLAWQVTPGAYDGVENLEWVLSTVELMKRYYGLMGAQGRMVVAGSGFEYDPSCGYCIESESPINPDSYYGKCKNAARLLFEAYLNANQLSGAWGRIFNVYGPGEAPQRLVPSVILSLLNGERASCSSGVQYRDYMHVYDVAEALVMLLEARSINGPVNIASGIPITVADIVLMIGGALDASSNIGLGDIPSTDASKPFSVADVTRLTSEVGFSPKFALAEGINHTIDWWKKSRFST